MKWRHRLYTGGVAGLVILVAWLTVPGLVSTAEDGEGTPLIGTTPDPVSDCDEVTFRATYLPEGWSYEWNEGSRGSPGTSPSALGNFGPVADKTGAYVEIWRYGDTYTIPEGEGKPIQVLDNQSTIGAIHEGFAVEFLSGGCEYSMVGFGVVRPQMRRIAEGLQWGHRCESPPVTGPDFRDENGRYFGYIHGVDIEDHGMGIQFDPAEFLTGEEADEAAFAAGAIEEGDSVPNDYFILNQSKRTAAKGFADDVEVMVETLQDGVPGLAPADIYWLACAFEGQVPQDRSHQQSPYWITIHDGQVVKVEEQYLP